MNARRIVSFFFSLVLLFAVMPSGVSAQSDPFDHGEGTEAGIVDSVAVEGFMENYFKAINELDGSAAEFLTLELAEAFVPDAVTYFDEYAYQAELYEADNVLQYEDGYFSVEVLSRGESLPARYSARRFYLISVDNPEGYAIDAAQRLEELRLPEGMSGATVEVIISDDGLSVSDDEVPAADILILDVENTSADILSTGIYVLPDGVEPIDAQAQLAIDDSSLAWLGGTPTGSGTTQIHAFVVDAGSTYLLQEFADGGDTQFRELLEGEQYIVTIAVGEGK